MPPIIGAAAFLMAEFLKIPYSEVVLAAIIPALFYYFAVFVQVDMIAARDDITVIDQKLPEIGVVLKAGWHFIIPFGVLLYALFELNAEAEIAALYSAVTVCIGGFLRSYKGRKLKLANLPTLFWETGFTMLDLLVIVVAAGFVIGVLNISSCGFPTIRARLSSTRKWGFGRVNNPPNISV